MRHTLDLLAKLRERNPDKAERALAIEMGYSDTAFQQVKKRKNMSPEMAAEVAARVGEDPREWALQAIVESTHDPKQKARLARLLHAIVYQTGLLKNRLRKQRRA